MSNVEIKTHSESFILGSEQEIEQVEEGIKRQMLGFDGQLMIAKVWFEAGAIGYAHKHFHSQVSYVESGEFEVTVDGVVKLLKAGDSFYIAPNKMHGALCKKTGVLLDVFSPARQDFLEK